MADTHPNKEKEKVKGKVEQWEGKAKEQAGKLGGDTSRELGGKIEQARGKMREGMADMDMGGSVEHREPEEEKKP